MKEIDAQLAAEPKPEHNTVNPSDARPLNFRMSFTYFTVLDSPFIECGHYCL